MTMLAPILALLAAIANASSNVLQRSGNRHEQDEDEFSLRLIGKLVTDRTWLIGLAVVLASFLIQAAAIGVGQLAEVEPLVVLELPITLVLGKFFLNGELHRTEWLSIATMTVGVVGLVLCLGPKGGSASTVDGLTWTLATIATALVVVVLFAIPRFRSLAPGVEAGLLGSAAGACFGLTSALTKGAISAMSQGPAALFEAWQTYLLLVFGLASMWLLQQAFNSGRLVAAQPGITLADPLIAIFWGTLVFGETTNGPLLLAFAGLFAAVMAAGGLLLARSAATSEGNAESEEGTYDSDRAPAGRSTRDAA